MKMSRIMVIVFGLLAISANAYTMQPNTQETGTNKRNRDTDGIVVTRSEQPEGVWSTLHKSLLSRLGNLTNRVLRNIISYGLLTPRFRVNPERPLRIAGKEQKSED